MGQRLLAMPSPPCLNLTPHLLMWPSTFATLSIALREVPFFPLWHLTFQIWSRGLTPCMQSPLTCLLIVGGRSDKPSTLITSARGTRQGCPLGAQLFALALHPHLCALARLVGENGLVIAYADDIHLIGSPATVGLALSSLTQMSTPVEALSLDCRLSSLGLALSPGKTSLLPFIIVHTSSQLIHTTY